MPQCVHILRKDLREQRAAVAAFVSLVVVLSWLDAMPAESSRLTNFLTVLPAFLIYFGAIVLVALVVQADPLVDDRAYWLVRPYSRRQLFAAKALFILLTINLPILLSQAVVLAVNGLAPWHWTGDLLARQLILTLSTILFSLALAATTKGLGQFIFVSLGLFVMGIVINSTLRSDGLSANAWSQLQWVNTSASLLVDCVLLTGALLWLYRRRRVRLAIALIAIDALLVPFVFTYLPTWSQAFPVQAMFSPRLADASLVRLELATGEPPKDAFPLGVSSTAGQVELRLPVTISAALPDVDALLDRFHVAIADAGGVRWESEWMPTPLAVPDGDKLWLRILMDQEIYDALKAGPVRLSVSAALTVYRRTGTEHVPAEPGVYRLRGGGDCVRYGSKAEVACRWPIHKPAAICAPKPGGTVARLQSEQPCFVLDAFQAPLPADFNLSVWDRFAPSGIRRDRVVSDLVYWEISGYALREASLEGVDLSRFEAGRGAGRPISRWPVVEFLRSLLR